MYNKKMEFDKTDGNNEHIYGFKNNGCNTGSINRREI